MKRVTFRRGRRQGFGQTGAGWVFGFLLCLLMPIFWRASDHIAFKILWGALFVLGAVLLLLNAFIDSKLIRDLMRSLWRRVHKKGKV